MCLPVCSLRNNALTQRCQAGAVSKNICAELFKVLELSQMSGELRAIPPDSFSIHSKLTAFASFKLGQTFRVCKLWISPSFLLLFSLERIEYFNCSKISMQMFEVLITILFYHIWCHCRAMEKKKKCSYIYRNNCFSFSVASVLPTLYIVWSIFLTKTNEFNASFILHFFLSWLQAHLAHA